VAFFVLTAMTATLYLVMYMLMYAAGLRLRYTRPDLPRTYKIPGGMGVMWLITLVGLAGVLFSCIAGFFPPSNLPVGNPALYVILVAGGLILFTGTPLVIHCIMRRKKQ
jgi:amino acid transporter